MLPARPAQSLPWTTSAKSGVGTAVGAQSNVWFTLARGILTEVYYPRIDRPATRDLGLLVTDGQGYFSEERRDTNSQIAVSVPGAPAYRLTNTSHDARYRIVKDVISDPHRPVVLQRIRFEPLVESSAEYSLHALLAPRLGDQPSENSARIESHWDRSMLVAEGNGAALALACSAPWKGCSVGFVGVSDGWQDLVRNKRMTWNYDRAFRGNVALMGEIDLGDDGCPVTLALGFGRSASEAVHFVHASLLAEFDTHWESYIEQWRDWQPSLPPLNHQPEVSADLYRQSAAVLRIHQAKAFPGAAVASLSIPWGENRGLDSAGYHLVWVRDLVEAAGGLIAAGEHSQARDVLFYLQAAQWEDGRWPQNMWIDGSPHATGVQLDEMALAILLVNTGRRLRVLDRADLASLFSMVRRSADFLVRHGPATEEDRWEKNGGFSPFTLAVEIAALLAAADLADLHGEGELGTQLRAAADRWNERIDDWTYVRDTALARRCNVDGYYLEIAPCGEHGEAMSRGRIRMRSRPSGQEEVAAEEIVGTDALALVRFGLHRPDDPRIVNTVRVIDATLKVDLPGGPAWRRYRFDGYGEHADGSPYDGSGIGRVWPLLCGERAHFELAAGRRGEAKRLLAAMQSMVGDGWLLPEQTWDSADVPAGRLLLGRPSGSAMPLVWAHAEYLKLCRSLHDGSVFDTPRQPVQRYLSRVAVSA